MYVTWQFQGEEMGQKKPDARLVEARANVDAATKLKNAGRYLEARIRIEHALALQEAALGERHPDVATSLNNLALLYREQGLYDRAEPLYLRALALHEAALGERHPNVATLLNNLAILYQAQGLYDRAEPLYLRALSLREAALGESHPDVAQTLHNLASLYREQGLYDRAEPLFLRALALREAALGERHPDFAQTLNSLASLYLAQGLYDRAEPLYLRALAIREAALGKRHPDIAQTLNNLALLYHEQGLYGRAEPLCHRALTLQEAALGGSHPDIAQTLNNLALLYDKQGLYGRAEPLYLRALAIREAALGKRHPGVAQTLNNLAGLYRAQGLYDRAEPLCHRALTLQEATLGGSHPDIATSLHNLALLYHEQGLYGRAEPLCHRALTLQEAALGGSHPDVATSLNNLAGLYYEQGLYDRAEPLYLRALSLREAALGERHPKVATSLNNLAALYYEQGLYDRAEPLYLRALALQKAALGERHPDVAQTLNNLALLYHKQGLYDRAEPLYLRALALREAALGERHPGVAQTLNNLALLYRAQGLYDRAEPLYLRALALREAALGERHPGVATSLHNLASLYHKQGLYDRAEPLYLRALALREAALGERHPGVATSLHNLAQLRQAQHRLADALPLYTRAFSISEQRLRQEALGFSESRLSSFLQYVRASAEMLYSLLRAYLEDARVQRLALGAVLLLKGRSVEETAHISRTLYLGLGAEDRDTFERLRGLRTQLATLSLVGPGSLPPKDYPLRLKALADEGDSLEADLAKRSAPLRALTALPLPAEIVDRVAASLPKDGALVEFIAYRNSPLVPKPGTPPASTPEQLRDLDHAALPSRDALAYRDISAPEFQPPPGTPPANTPNQLRYLALVLFPDASTQAVDLGPAAPIDRAVSRLRDALAHRDSSFLAPAQQLHQLAFQPLMPLLGSTRRLLLSPDGQLGLVPFSALHDGHDFLLDTFDFLYLTSGRELLPRPQGVAPCSSVFVLADPDFTASPPAAPSSGGPTPTRVEPPTSLEGFFSTVRANLASSVWPPLPGTRQEALAIQRLLPQAQLFLGSEATKERLLRLPTPGILHLATHGFFLEDSSAAPPPASPAVGQVEAPGPMHSSPGPLLRSGLALAGARAPAPDASSSSTHHAALVTALEMAGLNLWGTQLVVLSACDTGRGDVHLGQGIQGLRRALVVAGAETVVMSLWKVNDDSTRLLMETYYLHLMAGQGRASALRETMRSLRASHPHPNDWAPFIVLGSDAPLVAISP
ncbi:hypothetical protein CYFUS_004924 [Cystobacter fuscus]|uniref:CHAT domain-containing protein n=2 Tax=Cystobacter fuscus TaxID=43 RepID=A0A250J7G6_9BACT|nr:hypothetical protein CYFUS_004924 [Cystobacter fuscus]